MLLRFFCFCLLLLSGLTTAAATPATWWMREEEEIWHCYLLFISYVRNDFVRWRDASFFFCLPPYRKLREFSPRFSWRIVAHHTQVGSAWMNEIDMEKKFVFFFRGKIKEKFEFRVSALVIDEEDWQRSEEWSKTLMDVILFLFLY